MSCIKTGLTCQHGPHQRPVGPKDNFPHHEVQVSLCSKGGGTLTILHLSSLLQIPSNHTGLSWFLPQTLSRTPKLARSHQAAGKQVSVGQLYWWTGWHKANKVVLLTPPPQQRGAGFWRACPWANRGLLKSNLWAWKLFPPCEKKGDRKGATKVRNVLQDAPRDWRHLHSETEHQALLQGWWEAR